jgi:2-methylcitrate dehydratase PrpD
LKTLVQQLAGFAGDARDRGVPDAVLTDVTGRVLDALGNAYAAFGTSEADGIEPWQAIRTLITRWGGNPEASAIGVDHRLPAANAALLNGTLAHSLDFDDTHLPSVLHPSASVVPAVLAAAEAAGSSGHATLVAVAVGDEICNRLGMGSYDPSIRNSIFFEHGLHATSICGTIGGAAAVATLLGLDADGIAHAMAIACSMGAGLIEANRTGGTVKRVHCGWAAHAAVISAQMAEAGITGPPTVLEGRFGFYEALSRSWHDPEAIIGGLGVRWELLRTFYKPYPSNHFTHAGIDAAIALRTEHQLDPADIASMELGLPAPVMRSIAEPREEKIRPKSGYHGKFSGPFTVATALLGGGGLGVYLDDFTDAHAADPERLRLAAAVECVVDDECTAIFPHQFPAVLRIVTRGGASLEHRVSVNRGGPDNPLSADELALKFTLNASRSLRSLQVDELRQSVQKLGTSSGPLALPAGPLG